MARDSNWKVPLDYPGTLEDLSTYGITLASGMCLTVYTLDATDSADPDDLVALGSAEFDAATGRWFAVIDPESFAHVSEMDDVDRHLYAAARGSD